MVQKISGAYTGRVFFILNKGSRIAERKHFNKMIMTCFQWYKVYRSNTSAPFVCVNKSIIFKETG